jgi:DNA-binding NtrC family response regulator
MVEEKTADLNLDVLGLPERPVIEGADLQFAMQYEWPGNLRQLNDAVQAWLLCGCRNSFREIVAEMESTGGAFACSTDAIVRDRLKSVLSGRSQPYEKVGDLIEDIATEARGSIYDAYHREVIAKDQWEKVFTSQNLNNIRSTVSTFGPGRYRERNPE